MKVLTDEKIYLKHSRAALVSVVRLNLKMMENWREFQMKAWNRTFDCDATLILMAIMVIRSEHLRLHEPNGEFAALANPIPAHLLRKCNISSIAATTSLNRETVRRRVEALCKAELVVRESDYGIRLAPGVLQHPEVLEVTRSQLRAISRTVSELLRIGH